jgi:hypothetical protein
MRRIAARWLRFAELNEHVLISGDEVEKGPALKALVRARRQQRLLDDGRYASINELARADGDRPVIRQPRSSRPTSSWRRSA